MNVIVASDLLVKFVDDIGLSGSSGKLWGELMQAHIPSPNKHVEKYLLKTLCCKNDFKAFYNKEEMNVDKFICSNYELSLLILVAPMHVILRCFGVQTSSEKSLDSNCFKILEHVGKMKEKGALLTSISKDLGINQFHNVIDKLVTLGLVVKRMVAPNHQRSTRIRTNILHLKRFENSFVPSDHELQLEAAETVRMNLYNLINYALIQRNIDYMSISDMSKILDMKLSFLIKNKGHIFPNSKRNLYPIIVFELEYAKLNYGKHMIMKTWCVGKNPDYNPSEMPLSESLRMFGTGSYKNLPFHHQALHHLQYSTNGMTTSTLASILGISAKRMLRLSKELTSFYGVHSAKVQVGKQQMISLFPPSALAENLNTDYHINSSHILVPSSHRTTDRLTDTVTENLSVDNRIIASDIYDGEDTNTSRNPLPSSHTNTLNSILEASDERNEDSIQANKLKQEQKKVPYQQRSSITSEERERIILETIEEVNELFYTIHNNDVN